VFAVDERTGKRRWTHPGFVAAGAENSALVVALDGDTLSGYEPATGNRVWGRTFRLPFGTAPVADGRPRLLVQQWSRPVPDDLYLPRHALSSIEIATGAVTPVGSLDYNATALIGLGDPLAVFASQTDEGGRPVVQGGLAARPDQVWQFTAEPGLFQQISGSCGGLLCTSQGNLTTAVDPASGAQVWQADAGWENHRTMRVAGNDLLVTVRRGENGPHTLLLDPRTGGVRRDLANWSPLVAYRGRQLMLWTPASTMHPSWLGYVDESAPGGVRPLFPIGPALRCSATARWLYCEIVGGARHAAALRLDALDRMLP
jgi:putative pyrroloquinoline-quinone binding quinoprotein